jgi:uncharacterized protein
MSRISRRLQVVWIGGLVVAAAQATEPQWWKGVISAPGQPLDISVVFRPGEGGAYSGSMDIPVQGAKGISLSAIRFHERKMEFTLDVATAPAVFDMELDAEGKTATGTMVQRGLRMPVRMERTTEEGARAVGPPRPQTPKPPFPYSAREVEYENARDQTHLAGTLTIPEAAGPHPAVLLITGSGPQDRDETIFRHKPFAVLADHLTRRGIAVLRVDDRGVGGSGGGTQGSTSEDFAGDVRAGLRYLVKQPEIDPRRVALLGHSEGGLIAPMVAAKHPELAAIVLLAGPALPGMEILKLQLTALLKAEGVAAENIEKQAAAQQKALSLAAEGGAPAEFRAALRELITLQMAAGGQIPEATTVDELLAASEQQLTSPWMKWFVAHDPRPVLEQVQCPVLALFGELDLQVPPEQNVPEMEGALRRGGNRDFTVKRLPGLNHLLQPAMTGTVVEYAQIEQTLDPGALDLVADWLRDKLKVK